MWDPTSSRSTTIERDGDELVITGRKSFITNAGDAAFYCILGREDEGYSLVLVPADTDGLEVEHPHQIIAPHILGDVVLTGARAHRPSHRRAVPASRARHPRDVPRQRRGGSSRPS